MHAVRIAVTLLLYVLMYVYGPAVGRGREGGEAVRSGDVPHIHQGKPNVGHRGKLALPDLADDLDAGRRRASEVISSGAKRSQPEHKINQTLRDLSRYSHKARPAITIRQDYSSLTTVI